jgi:hypothetical protein
MMLLGRRFGGRKALPYVAAKLVKWFTSHQFCYVLEIKLESTGSDALVDADLEFVFVFSDLVVLKRCFIFKCLKSCVQQSSRLFTERFVNCCINRG